MSGASLFDALEKEFNDVLAAESRNVGDSADAVRQLEDLLKQLSLETRSSSEELRQPLTLRVNKAKAALSSFKLELDRAKLLTSKDGGGLVSPQLRQQHESIQSKLSQQNAAILNAHKAVAESEAVGGDIVAELGRNREKIRAAQGRAGELKGEVDSATARLKSMTDREKCCIA